MNYPNLVPSRELCEQLRDLNICQDEPELFYVWHKEAEDIRAFVSDVRGLSMYPEDYWEHLISPTLPRMMADLPDFHEVQRYCNEWHIDIPVEDSESLAKDKHLPSAIAKCLISLKKGQ